MSSSAQPQPTAQQPTFTEEPAQYIFTQILTANQPLNNLSVNIDRDADFLLTGINGSSTGAYTLNFKLPSGRKINNVQVSNQNMIGTANQPTAIGPPPLYRAGSVGPQLDLTDTSGAGNTVVIVFSGIRRIRTA